MAAGNTKFRADNGLDVRGNANVSGTMRVDGDLSIGGNLAVALNVTGDIKPTANLTYNLGTGTLRWMVYGGDGDFSGNVAVGGFTTLNNLSIANAIPSANDKPLGSATRRWAISANTVDITTSLFVGNGTVNVAANGTYLTVGNTTVNTQLTAANVNINTDLFVTGNVTIDTSTLFVDTTNDRIGFKNTSPSNAALITVTGNVEFSTSNTGLRLLSSNATMNASLMLVGNTTNTRVTFNTFESGTSTQSGGYVFQGTNATATQTLLEFNNTILQYKSGNVASKSNFGIYNVSGTRVGP